MKLLDAEITSAEASKKGKEAQERIRQIYREETKAVDDLNKPRTESEKKKEELKEETDKFIAQEKARAALAKKEADAMESFRRDVLKVLLKPIDEIEKEAKRKMEVADKKELELDKENKELQREREDLRNRESLFAEYEKKVLKIQKEFDAREKALNEREQHTKDHMARREKNVQRELARARQLLEKVK